MLVRIIRSLLLVFLQLFLIYLPHRKVYSMTDLKSTSTTYRSLLFDIYFTVCRLLNFDSFFQSIQFQKFEIKLRIKWQEKLQAELS